MRYPSYPLIAHDPYFSIWSPSDNLNDSWTKHWTGANHEICGIIRIDGKPYCYLGNPRGFDKLPQTSVTWGLVMHKEAWHAAVHGVA